MIEPAHHRLSITAQCRLLSISRSSYYYAPVPEAQQTLALMRVIDATFLDCPWYGSRQMVRHLRRAGHQVGRRRVRCADVTYIPMRRGFLYLVAVMDWATRKVLAWRLSNTMDAGFCVAALEEALARFGIFEFSHLGRIRSDTMDRGAR